MSPRKAAEEVEEVEGVEEEATDYEALYQESQKALRATERERDGLAVELQGISEERVYEEEYPEVRVTTLDVGTASAGYDLAGHMQNLSPIIKRGNYRVINAFYTVMGDRSQMIILSQRRES